MAAELGAGRRERKPEPAVEAEYGIKAVTARIDDLYERLAARRPLRAGVSRPAPGVAQDAAPTGLVQTEVAPAAGPVPDVPGRTQ